MKKSTKPLLNKFLKEMTKPELEKEIKKLYSKFKEVKQYYEMELSGDTTDVLNQFKLRLQQEYFPKRGYGKARSGANLSNSIYCPHKKREQLHL